MFNNSENKNEIEMSKNEKLRNSIIILNVPETVENRHNFNDNKAVEEILKQNRYGASLIPKI